MIQLSKTHKEFCALSKVQQYAEYEQRIEDSWNLIKTLERTDEWKLNHGSRLEDGLVYVLNAKETWWARTEAGGFAGQQAKVCFLGGCSIL